MEFKLPELGEGVTEGELVKWNVKIGDDIKHDQVLCEVMTDKATIEIPSPHAGKVSAIHVKEGSTVQVHDLMISFNGTESSSVKASAEKPHSESKSEKKKEEAPPAPSSNKTHSPSPQMSASPARESGSILPQVGGEVRAAPSTRKLAREIGVDLNTISGSGPEGRVLKKDVINFQGATVAGSPSFSKSLPQGFRNIGAPQSIPFRGLRKKIAEKMRLSKDKAAHFTYVEEADASALVKLRSQAKLMGEKQGIKVTYLPFIMKAMACALKKYPILNASLDEEKGEIIMYSTYNIGLSIQTDDGLTAPIVKAVEQKSILELAAEIQDIVTRARSKQLTLEDFKGGTITLTNAGSIGGLFATPVINFPEVAILGFNKIFRKPVVKNIRGVEKIVIRDWTYFSISLDHRIVDGAIGAEFMNEFIQYIENPSMMILN